MKGFSDQCIASVYENEWGVAGVAGVAGVDLPLTRGGWAGEEIVASSDDAGCLITR